MEDTIKWEDFVKEHKIDVSELPENVQHKSTKQLMMKMKPLFAI